MKTVTFLQSVFHDGKTPQPSNTNCPACGRHFEHSDEVLVIQVQCEHMTFGQPSKAVAMGIHRECFFGHIENNPVSIWNI